MTIMIPDSVKILSCVRHSTKVRGSNSVNFVPQFVETFSEMRDSLGGLNGGVNAYVCVLLNVFPCVSVAECVSMVYYIQGKIGQNPTSFLKMKLICSGNNGFD